LEKLGIAGGSNGSDLDGNRQRLVPNRPQPLNSTRYQSIPGDRHPEEKQIVEMTTSLELGIEKGFYSIKPQI